jgi:hypothetical protein
MATVRVKDVKNGKGEPAAVIIPIALRREIASEREMACLLKSDKMKRGLLAALNRKRRIPFQEALEKLGS